MFRKFDITLEGADRRTTQNLSMIYFTYPISYINLVSTLFIIIEYIILAASFSICTF